jgi:hypothetical protein
LSDLTPDVRSYPVLRYRTGTHYWVKILKSFCCGSGSEIRDKHSDPGKHSFCLNVIHSHSYDKGSSQAHFISGFLFLFFFFFFQSSFLISCRSLSHPLVINNIYYVLLRNRMDIIFFSISFSYSLFPALPGISFPSPIFLYPGFYNKYIYIFRLNVYRGGIAAELLRRRRGNENREPLMEEISEKNSLLTLNIFLFRSFFILAVYNFYYGAFWCFQENGTTVCNPFLSVYWLNAYSATPCTIAPCYFCPYGYK